MKLIVREKLDCGEDIRFAVDLPKEFDCYKPEFLMTHFSHYMTQAYVDLRVPENLDSVIRMNEDWFALKMRLLPGLGRHADKEFLEKIMNEIRTGFIEPERRKK